MFKVITPASDLLLLTLAELRGAVGVADDTQDFELQILGRRVSAMIAQACNVVSDGVNEPTLKRETCQEVFRTACPQSKLVLARTPVSAITGITVGGFTLAPDDWEFKAASGLLFRLHQDVPVHWCGKVVVDYSAGFAVAPNDLKLAAIKLARTIWTNVSRDPSLRREEVPGVLIQEFWVGSTSDSGIPADIFDFLQPYINRAF